MKSIKVRELMIPLSEYATVFEEDSLYDAIVSLEKAQKNFRQSPDRHRAVLVFNKDRKIIGKLSQLDVIRGLEPKYEKFGDISHISRFGLSPFFINSMLRDHMLWQRPMDDICRKATKIKVKDIMYTPTDGEYVQEDASLDEAIHQLIIGHHQSLLVVKDEDIIGILRLTDVFREIANEIKACHQRSSKTG